MDDELLKSYDQELSYLRRAGLEFARKHPKIAGRLRLGPEQIEDPHVSRLVESVAFLNARVRRKLDDDFPELTDGILGMLSPHFLSPIPSMSVMEFTCAPDLAESTVVERGTSLVTDSSYGEQCRYRTVYDAEVAPIDLLSVRLQSPPFQSPSTPGSRRAGGLLHVELAPQDASVALGDLLSGRLRFFLNGEFRHMTRLYELLVNDVIEVVVAQSPQDPRPRITDASGVQPVGFGEEESMLPECARSHPHQRLLTEYFAFPHKFLFVDVADLDTEGLTDRLHLFLFLRRSITDLEQLVDAETLKLGCTPIVNLFQRKAEPTRLDGQRTEYHLIPDKRHEQETEIYSIDGMRASSRAHGSVDYAPFYGLGHDLDPSGSGRYWHTARRETPAGEDDVHPGTEIYVSLVDDQFEPDAPGDWVLETDVTCLNRNQPARLPYGGGHPKMTFSKGGGAIVGLRCLTPPTPTVRPARGRGAMWRLVSLLNLHSATLVEGEHALQNVQECLRLFDAVAAPETRRIPDALLEVNAQPVVRRVVSGGQPGFCRGLQIDLLFDEERLKTTGVFLLASVLERFLSGYCTLNSFVETVARTTLRDRAMKRWPPRSGSRILL